MVALSTMAFWSSKMSGIERLFEYARPVATIRSSASRRERVMVARRPPGP
jgi:hypothetical protein